ncbi:MAG: PA14 domain-containing protein [Pirellulales bacterium]
MDWQGLFKQHRPSGAVGQAKTLLRVEPLERRDLLSVFAIPAAFLTHDAGAAGLVGNYVNTSLRNVAAQNDWRATQTISGTRTDAIVNFATANWGTRATVGITGGTDANWDNFSVQWDGFVTVAAAGTRLYTRSDDGSRMWVDINNDGTFGQTGAEFIDDNWGNGQAATTGPSSPALAAGTYRIRLQFEDGGGEQAMVFGWNDAARSAGLVDSATIITETGTIGAVGEVDQVSLDLKSGDTLTVNPLSRANTDLVYSPSVEIVKPGGETLSGTLDGHSLVVVAPTTGVYTARISSQYVLRAFTGDYQVSFRSAVFAGTVETEPNNSQGSGTALTPSTAFRGTLSTTADVDYFRFTGTAGQAVAIKFANLPADNPAVRLYRPGGSLIATSLDGAGLSAMLPSSGVYTVSMASDNAAGAVTGEYCGSIALAANATLESTAAGGFDNAAVLPPSTVQLVPGQYLKQSAGGAAGLVGSYVNAYLYWRTTQDDWRSSQTISGTRVDTLINFPTAGWGSRAAVGVTSGTDQDWDLFAVQWDGFLTIPTAGTRLYTRSDDSSRMWIDINNDGAFAASGSELVDNNWGNGQGATTSSPSVALAAGTYRIRIQYGEGYGANEMYLLWDDADHSAGPMPGPTVRAVGSLSSTDDADLFAVDLVAGNAYEFKLEANDIPLATEDRVLSLANASGQMLAYAINGSLRVDVPLVQNGRHFLVVRAAGPAGLGGYSVSVAAAGAFPVERDLPLYYFDFTGNGTYWGYHAQPFNRTDAIPVITGMFKATFDVNDMDITLTPPAAGTERVAIGVGDSGLGGGLGGGGRGNVRPSGDAACGVSGEASWTQLNDGSWAYDVTKHEAGHAAGMPHLRSVVDIMSYDSQLNLFPVGQSFPFGENPTPARSTFRERDYMDWVTQAGRYASEIENNDTAAAAQNLDPFFAEMAADADGRNDRAVILGEIGTTADRDYFRFHADAGETFAFDIDSAEFQDPLDATLTLFDAAGLELASSDNALDRDTGLESVDPYLTRNFTSAGTYYVQVAGTRATQGNYRLKVTPKQAFDAHGPRVLASWPDGGKTVDSTRQLTFWFDDQIDPATLTSANIEVRGQTFGVRAGTMWFDPLDVTLVWRANTVLPSDTYTVTFRSGAGGLADLHGNQLDGETDGTLNWPQVSGNGAAGGNFTTRFTVSGSDAVPASVSWSEYRRTAYNWGQFSLHFNDELDTRSIYSANLTLRSTGPDGQFDTTDDVILAVDPAVEKVAAVGDPHLTAFSRGVPEPGFYRLNGTVLDATGKTVNFSRTFSVGTAVVPGEYLTKSVAGGQGLVGSFVNQSLRGRATQDDWRVSQTISGTRTDAKLDFQTGNWGTRAIVGVTGGSDADWENFSVQWDGFITVPDSGLRLYTRSDDGSRMWIDLNGDGTFNTTGSELVNNNWGAGQGATTGPPSVPLAAGTYRIRVQYEEGNGGNEFQLLWDHEPSDLAAGGQTRTTNVANLNVQPGSVVETAVDRIEVTFSGAVDPATLTPSSFKLRYSADPSFFDGNDTFIADADGTIAWDPTHNRATLRPAAPLTAGYYLVELSGSAGGIADRYGRLLDGEFLGSAIQGNTLASNWANTPSGDALPGGDYRASFSVLAAPPPMVQGAAVNAGGPASPQRAMVTNVAVTFSGLVQLDAGALEVAQTGDGTATVSVATSEVAGKTVATVTFVAGTTLVESNGSLKDGNYVLTVHGDLVHDTSFGTALDGDGDGSAGGDYTFAFFRLACDTQGDGKVDIFDVATLQVNYGQTNGMTPAQGDFDGDADVDIFDVALLQVQYGKSLSIGPAAMPIAAMPATSTAAPVSSGVKVSLADPAVVLPETTLAPRTARARHRLARVERHEPPARNHWERAVDAVLDEESGRSVFSRRA